MKTVKGNPSTFTAQTELPGFYSPSVALWDESQMRDLLEMRERRPGEPHSVIVKHYADIFGLEH